MRFYADLVAQRYSRRLADLLIAIEHWYDCSAMLFEGEWIPPLIGRNLGSKVEPIDAWPVK